MAHPVDGLPTGLGMEKLVAVMETWCGNEDGKSEVYQQGRAHL